MRHPGVGSTSDCGINFPASMNDARPMLERFVARHRRLFVLTGAGCSTESGIPDYRDTEGAWKRPAPVTYQAFVSDPMVRRRYWARSLVGWRRLRHALPNRTHRALACLEALGRVERLVTQNVDGLHQAAGSRDVLDLHGRIDRVVCLQCGRKRARDEIQLELVRGNPSFAAHDGGQAPDGDADLDGVEFSSFDVPVCRECGGMLKSDVVYFGESVPRTVVASATASLERADAMLVVGSSLMVYSAYRFVRAFALAGKPIAAVNLGRTRADDLLTFKVAERCSDALAFVLGALGDGTVETSDLARRMPA